MAAVASAAESFTAISRVVIAGLDPAIHHGDDAFSFGWMRGSSPRMTPAA
jgi:hypothetical protein